MHSSADSTPPSSSAYLATLWQSGLRALAPTKAQLEHGLELHRSLDICDGYGFLPRVFTAPFREKNQELVDRGIGKALWGRHYWSEMVAAPAYDPEGEEEFLGALEQAGLAGLVHPINDVGESLADSLSLLAAYRHLCHRFPDHLFQATRGEELTGPGRQGRTGLVFSLTGLPVFGAGSMVDPEGLLDWLTLWYRIGVRFMHLGYNRRNLFADGCTEEANGGLSSLGYDLVRELNRVGITPDISHTGEQSTLETIRASSRPVVATHTGCAALYSHPRCKSDAILKALADTGGYAGIFSIPSFLGDDAALPQMLQHVAHAVAVVGAEHVTIGTDSSYLSPISQRQINAYPGKTAINRGGWQAGQRGCQSEEHLSGSLAWTNWPLYTVGLVCLGLKDEQIAQILGGNLRRILSEP